MTTPCLYTPKLPESSVNLSALQKTPEAILARFSLPECNRLVDGEIGLGWQADKLSLFTDAKTAVNIDFTAGKLLHRLKFGGGKGQPLARAVGLQKALQNQAALTILDATAGLAGDSFVFASLGAHVTLIERNPFVALLIEDALIRAQAANIEALNPIIQRMTLFNTDGVQKLQQLPAHDVVYLDPMYPEKKKSAAAKKGMQALQKLVGPDTDSQDLLASALTAAKKRVVVKRPKGAPPLIGPKPSESIQSPNTRYDLYFIPQ